MESPQEVIAKSAIRERRLQLFALGIFPFQKIVLESLSVIRMSDLMLSRKKKRTNSQLFDAPSRFFFYIIALMLKKNLSLSVSIISLVATTYEEE